MSNLGSYQGITTLAKKIGSPEELLKKCYGMGFREGYEKGEQQGMLKMIPLVLLASTTSAIIVILWDQAKSKLKHAQEVSEKASETEVQCTDQEHLKGEAKPEIETMNLQKDSSTEAGVPATYLG